MHLNLPLWTQVGANLLSLLLALVLGWRPELILLLFWAENAVIGIWQIPRFYLADSAKLSQHTGTERHTVTTGMHILGASFIAGFFTLHYGLFTFVHGSFVFELFLHEPLNAQNLADLAFSNNGLILALTGMFISHGIEFVQDIITGTARTMKKEEVMSAPYKRIVIMHLVLIGSGFLLMSFPYPMVSVILLIAIKIFFDVHSERKAISQWTGHVS